MSQIVEVLRADRSPLNAGQWLVSLACGHEAWVTSNGRPSKLFVVCAECPGDAPGRCSHPTPTRAADDAEVCPRCLKIRTADLKGRWGKWRHASWYDRPWFREVLRSPRPSSPEGES